MDGMWFNFPMPFKRGDILVEKKPCCLYKEGDPVVITALGTWDKTDYLENGYTERDKDLAHCEFIHNYLKKNGDASDMTYSGYFACEDGSFYHETEHGLLNCEYYTAPLTGGYRILKVVSDFEKGDLSSDMLVKLARHIMDEEKLKEELKYIHLQEEYLKELGIK